LAAVVVVERQVLATAPAVLAVVGTAQNPLITTAGMLLRELTALAVAAAVVQALITPVARMTISMEVRAAVELSICAIQTRTQQPFLLELPLMAARPLAVASRLTRLPPLVGLTQLRFR
jgi:hypothetical protein